MKRARFTEEQIIAVLKEHEAGAKNGNRSQAENVHRVAYAQRDAGGEAMRLAANLRLGGANTSEFSIVSSASFNGNQHAFSNHTSARDSILVVP